MLRPNIRDYGCSCRKKNECPMQNKFLTANIMYEATVTNKTDIVGKIYFRLCKTSFKKRYCNHTRSFRLKRYSYDTELSTYVRDLIHIYIFLYNT